MVTSCRYFVLAFVGLFLAGCDGGEASPTPQNPGAALLTRPEPAPPLPDWNEETYNHDVLPPARRAAFYKRRFTDFYRDHGNADAAWFEDAQAFLDAACDYLAYQDFDGYLHPRQIASRTQLVRWMRELEKKGCAEPLVMYVGRLCEGFRDRAGRQEVIDRQTAYREWAEGLDQKPRYILSVLAVDHVVMLASQRVADISKSWVRRWANGNVSSFLIALKPEIELTPADEVELARLFDYYAEGMDAEQARVFLQHSREPAETRRWLAHTLRGTAYLYYAWAERGGGVYAYQVKRSAWPRFAKLLERAEAEYGAALRLRPFRVEPASRMITIAMGQSVDGGPYRWFEHAVELDPFDKDAYSNGIWSHRAQWFRDPQTILRVARRAFEMDDYNTDVPDWGRYAIEKLIFDFGTEWWARHHEEIWPELAAYIERRVQRPDPRSDAAFFLQTGFKMAHAAGRSEDRWDYYQRMKPHNGRVLDGYLFGIDQRWVIDRMHAEQEPAVAAALVEVDRLNTPERLSELIDLMDQTVPQAQHERATRHLRDLRRVATWSRAYLAGQTIDLFEHGLEGWLVTRGRWSETDAGVVGRDSPGDGLRIAASFRPGSRYRATLTADVPEEFHTNGWALLGFTLDPVMQYNGAVQHWAAAAGGTPHAAGIYEHGVPSPQTQYFGRASNPRRIELVLERWDRSLRLTVNGETAVDHYELQEPGPTDGRLGVGVWKQRSGPLNITLHSLEITRLEESPFADTEPPRPPFGN